MSDKLWRIVTWELGSVELVHDPQAELDAALGVAVRKAFRKRAEECQDFEEVPITELHAARSLLEVCTGYYVFDSLPQVLKVLQAIKDQLEAEAKPVEFDGFGEEK